MSTLEAKQKHFFFPLIWYFFITDPHQLFSQFWELECMGEIILGPNSDGKENILGRELEPQK